MRNGSGRYLVRQGAGYRFQMAVPSDLQSIVGKKVWRRYISGEHRAEAELMALQMATQLQKEISRLRDSLSVQSQDGFSSSGIEQRTDVVLPVHKITDLVEVWKKHVNPKSSASTLRMLNCAREFGRVTGVRQVNDVTRQHVLQFRDVIERRNYARGTALGYLQCCHRLFSVAASEGLLSDNPFSGIHLQNNLLQNVPPRYLLPKTK